MNRPPGSPAVCRAAVAVCLAGVALLAPLSVAYAHSESGLQGGFVAGFTHPLLGVDHLLAMVAVGLWGAILGRPLLVALPVIFPVVMAFGGALGMAGVPTPPVEVMIALSVVVLGALIAFRVSPPVWLACVVVAVFAVFHGYAHGQELPSAADPLGYSLGFVLATGLLHVAGIGLAWFCEKRNGLWLVRGAGGLIGLAGLGFLIGAFAA